jgi:hypothetical protein
MLVVRWTIATAVGFLLVSLLPCASGLSFWLFGPLASLPQALAVRNYGRSALAWVAVTSVAVPVGFVFGVFGTLVASSLLASTMDLPALSLGLGSVVAGFVVGAFQAIVFSRHAGARTSLRWAAASAIAGPAAGAFVLLGRGGIMGSGCEALLPLPVLGIALGAIYGAITGGVLKACLEETQA